ncbi:M20/M25/M40 family metallo-hydrolase [Sphingomonas sp. OK281]|uniref:M20/M25/M40 family metallo-hydrolase n=1 Tax=Sphingomonas sp. OK281 TaxID=1881067 RepID=UPI0008E611D5|nr:M20/M25/M40 family metallo-hydrolase [Sphingomonas sp. OK281]SFN81859.1 Acetylornithine deacetylase/Succinyl-diaminopimelate desuccinylase [Sphingomonas sp. OK281]
MTSKLKLLLACTAAMTALPASAQTPAAAANGLEIAKKMIAFRSVRGPGNQTPQLAAYLKATLVAGGFAADDVTITPVDDTAYLIATWKGSDPALKPIVVSGHIDVVEAKPADWQRDPFTAVVENGYLYGRGATDMKLDAALAIATLLDMKKAGYKPKRGIVLALSGDEETVMKTSSLIAEKLKASEMALNIDGGGGLYAENGKPEYFTIGAAEKTYADFQMEVTNPGGHSSAPRKVNAINELSAALVKIGGYRFTPQLSPITKGYFEGVAPRQTPELGAAMRAFVADPTDQKAIETLAANTGYVGQIGTTCVTTMVSGGHALNALPQRATANINCRIFPGVKPATVMAELAKVAADPGVKFSDVTEGSNPTDASPLRADLTGAVKAAMGKIRPGVPIFPSMSAGASDSMWYRSVGVPSYGVSPIYIKQSDDFSHGLNERTPIDNIPLAITYYRSLLTDLTK